jgi:tetratricopeptide (TPR) repeat protein
VFTAPERWMDLVNVLFLALGGVLFLLPVLLFVLARKRLLSEPALLFALTAAAGGLTLLLFGNTFLGLARDWDVAAFAVLGCLMFALASLQILHTRGILQLPALLPAIAAVVLSQLLLWVAVNTDEEASAARFARIAEMDEGVILPMNSFTAWENLRKFHRSGGEQQAYFVAMQRLIATGYRRDVSYAEYLSAVLQLRDPGERSREMAWLFSTLRQDAASAGTSDRPGVSGRFFPEFSMRCLLSAWQTGHTDLVVEYLPSFETMYPSWPEKGLLTLLQSELPPDAARAALDAAVSDSTRDAFLLMTAGGLYQRYGFHITAARKYDSALQREPTTYPSWYLVAARLHLDHTGDTGQARLYLEACIRNAPTSPEAGQARDLLARLP